MFAMLSPFKILLNWCKRACKPRIKVEHCTEALQAEHDRLSHWQAMEHLAALLGPDLLMLVGLVASASRGLVRRRWRGSTASFSSLNSRFIIPLQAGLTVTVTGPFLAVFNTIFSLVDTCSLETGVDTLDFESLFSFFLEDLRGGVFLVFLFGLSSFNGRVLVVVLVVRPVLTGENKLYIFEGDFCFEHGSASKSAFLGSDLEEELTGFSADICSPDKSWSGPGLSLMRFMRDALTDQELRVNTNDRYLRK